LTALQSLAAFQRSEFNIPVIGITGSNGKTIVKEWLYQLLHRDYKITRSPRSYNSQIGVPLSVWQLNKDTELGIFEAGISQCSEMERLEPIIRPTIGIFTHIGEAHQENFVSLKEKCLEKLKLFAETDTLIYCIDDKLIDICVEQSGYHKKKFTWGKAEKADIKIENVELKIENGSTLITYSFPKFSIFNFQFSIPFVDKASIENALHCLALLLHLGIEETKIAERIATLQTVAMRLEVKQGINNSLIINDSYNSDLSSLSIALDFLQQQAADKNLKKTLILSDILQSGQTSAELYQTVAELIKNKGIQQFIGIGEEIKNEELRMKNFLADDCESTFFKTTDKFLQSLVAGLTRNDRLTGAAILLKGSRDFHFEKISEKLEQVAHQTVLEVDLNALAHNFNYFRSFLKPETKVVSMVKAHAYGSGASEVSRALQRLKCDYLAVAVADEGAELRGEGIHIPIMVMNPEQHSFGLIFEHNLEPEIYSFNILQSFIKEAERQGVIDYPIHLKIDTGMHRLGFSPEEIDKLIDILKSQNSLKIRSIFSHLAGADEQRFDDFTKKQISVFEEVNYKFEKNFEHKILRHILNSAGIERFPEYQFDMVRLGIGHYGMSAVNQQNVQNVCSLKTTILQIRDVPAGETVGYSRKGKIQNNSRIAVLPIGYADGYNRRLGNGYGSVFVNGKLAPTVGNVCMDLTMIDITGIDAKESDSVELFGNNLSILEVSDWLGTIPYEILTNISRRVKRVYFQE
ncbi:MAG: bifunctional UDP-N-acetylmuramoyl-tripeptide:D-alanyl-D-alanine ligase/alanine racemase, partial [Prevotellaceae bacterium]|nr:bifunctional UDP-N-acetylmuramoyl-tripeptide:D-alanyl-D-alanine ligase/alanine racemase [Prevotellaceae bacterium]